MSLHASAIKYWKDGSTDITPNPQPLKKGDKVRPYIIRLSNNGWIPANVLVFAKDKDQALDRFLFSLEECCARDYHGVNGQEVGNNTRYITRNKAHDLLEKLRNFELKIDIQPYNRQIISKVQWACNDTITQ